MTPDLADVLTEARTDAAVLRKHGDRRIAEALDVFCLKVEAAATDWLAWISEQQALDRSGKSPDFFRARRDTWLIDGLARKDGRRWYYRRCIVPRSRLASIVRAEAAMERVG